MYLWRTSNRLISGHRSSNDIEKIEVHVADLCIELKVEVINTKWMYDNPDTNVMVIKVKDKYGEEKFLGNICKIKDIK